MSGDVHTSVIKCTMHFPGPWPLTFFFLSLFWLGESFMALTYGVVILNLCTWPAWPPPPPPPPQTSVPTEAAELLGTAAWAPMGLILQGRACKYYFLWLVILLFLTDVNDVCYCVHNMPWFWFKHVGNVGMIAAWLLPPWHQCTLYVH